MRIMPTSPPSRRPGPPWLEGRRRLLTGLTGLLLVLVAGTIGYVGFGLSLLDALFQTVITVSTVGFGEARPFGSGAKVFTIVLIFVGVATAAYTFGVGIDTLVEGYLDGTFGRRRMERRIGAMRGHMILCGWGRVGQAIARRAGGADMVVVDASAERIGTVSGPYVHGDATSEEVLRAAGIDRARVLVTALNTDADNLYVTLTARSMAPGLFIVSRAASEAAVGKLIQAGADRVVNPQDLGGARIAALERRQGPRRAAWCPASGGVRCGKSEVSRRVVTGVRAAVTHRVYLEAVGVVIVLLSLVRAVVSWRRYVARVRPARSRAGTETAKGAKHRPGQTRRARMMARMEERWRRGQRVTAGCWGGPGAETARLPSSPQQRPAGTHQPARGPVRATFRDERSDAHAHVTAIPGRPGPSRAGLATRASQDVLSHCRAGTAALQPHTTGIA